MWFNFEIKKKIHTFLRDGGGSIGSEELGQVLYKFEDDNQGVTTTQGKGNFNVNFRDLI